MLEKKELIDAYNLGEELLEEEKVRIDILSDKLDYLYDYRSGLNYDIHRHRVEERKNLLNHIRDVIYRLTATENIKNTKTEIEKLFISEEIENTNHEILKLEREILLKRSNYFKNKKNHRNLSIENKENQKELKKHIKSYIDDRRALYKYEKLSRETRVLSYTWQNLLDYNQSLIGFKDGIRGSAAVSRRKFGNKYNLDIFIQKSYYDKGLNLIRLPQLKQRESLISLMLLEKTLNLKIIKSGKNTYSQYFFHPTALRMLTFRQGDKLIEQLGEIIEDNKENIKIIEENYKEKSKKLNELLEKLSFFNN